MEEKLLEMAREAMKHAYAPYSNFKVGACFRAEDDTLFVGCNVENAAYGLTQCAEACALGALVVAGKKQIKEAVIISLSQQIIMPCGACRQLLCEFAEANVNVHLYNAAFKKKTLTIETLLPYSFNREFLELT